MSIFNKLRKLKKTQFLDKRTMLNFQKEYRESFWLENYFNFNSNKKIKKLSFLKKKFEYKNSKWFLDLIGPKIEFQRSYLPKKYGQINNAVDMLNILSIDEYINKRNNISIIDSNNQNLELKIFYYIELLFQITLEKLVLQRNFEEFLFLVFETYRYEYLNYFVKGKKKQINLICFFIAQKFSKLTKKFKYWINKILNSNYLPSKNIEIKKQIFGVKKLPKIFIHKKKSNFIKFLKKNNFFQPNVSLFSSKKLLDNLSKSGMIDPNFYWCKTIFRVFFSFFFRIFNKKIQNSLLSSYFKKKKIKEKKIIRIIDFYNNVASDLDLSIISLKFSTIFGIGVIFKNSNNFCYLEQFLSKYENLTSWERFFIGISIFFTNKEIWKFYKKYINLIKNNTISKQIKGGFLFGIGLKYSKLISYEKMLKKNFFNSVEKSSDQIEEYGKIIGTSILFSQKIKDPKKSHIGNKSFDLIFSDSLKNTALSLSLGFLFLGSSSEFLFRKILILYQETVHIKTSKFLVICISLIFFGSKAKGEIIFRKFISQKDPIFRLGGIFVQTLSFLKTGNLQVGRKFLKIIGIDSDYNVQRASAIGIGFIFYSKFNMAKNILKQLSSHQNPHVRYGTCFAIAISDNRKKNKEALCLLRILCEDSIDFVRQGAHISLGLMFYNQKICDKKLETKKLLKEVLLSTDEKSNFSKFGSVIGHCLIETLNNDFLRNKNFGFNDETLVRMFLFCHHWNFLPFLKFIYF